MVLAFGVEEGTSPPEVQALLRKAENEIRDRGDLTNPAEHPVMGAWRQAVHTSLSPGVRAADFNLDGLPPVRPEDISLADEKLTGLISRFCGEAGRTVI